ncbi:MAG: superoxide dismutase [Deltaproteobacteria bacterium]|nr:superoxide dismutase [Deltaproteobacteria bacterium]
MCRHHPAWFVVVLALILPLACGAGGDQSTGDKLVVKPYEARDFSRLKGMQGFSDHALDQHFTLYQGYVRNTNLLLEELTQMAREGKTATPAYAELKRRLGWEWNGMRLHELYFDNLGGKEPLPKDSLLMKKIEANFGAYEAWQADFRATGAMRGIGWVVLFEDQHTGRLVNAWINEHDLGHLAGATPLLIMDVFEHAVLPDYGLKRGEYINAFCENINWAAVQARLRKEGK